MPKNRYELIYKASVNKDLRKLPVQVRINIIEKIQALGSDPYPDGSLKIRGSKDLYRMRYTEYRIIYQFKHDQVVIRIIKVGHRKDVYRAI